MSKIILFTQIYQLNNLFYRIRGVFIFPVQQQSHCLWLLMHYKFVQEQTLHSDYASKEVWTRQILQTAVICPQTNCSKCSILQESSVSF